VAYPLAPVGPDAVGGAEHVLRMLDDALVANGDRSWVVACGGSRCAGRLVTVTVPRGRLERAAIARAQRETREAILAALEAEPADLIHFHGIDFTEYLPQTRIPVVVTLHLPPSWYPPEVFAQAGAGPQLVCVSDAQRRACPAGAETTVIPNGVRLDLFRPGGTKQRFALCLGRICPEKGFHLALSAGARARMPVLLGGHVFAYPAHQEYFAQQVAPRLDRARRFLGPVGLEAKRYLLPRASCLLVPSLVDETSSLVAMEALASGTPVIAFRRGALAELIEPGRTGFLVSGWEEMAEAMLQVGSLAPQECRAEAERRFGAALMTQRYLQLYRGLLGRPR
jgi:glycosyltransferase involved in cell wall biosynthesis